MDIANQVQFDFWTSPAGLAWVDHQDSLDTAMSGILDVLLEAATLSPDHRVLDVGCGTGASTLAAARLVPRGMALGLDIAPQMLERARRRAAEERAGNASFRLCDAQVEPLAGADCDVLISRFGMSFFGDTVAALSNLATALKDKGRMVFVSWAGLDENPWFLIPQELAQRRLGAPPEPPSDAPGPLAFADPAHVLDLMRRAGLEEGQAETRRIDLTPPGGVSGAARLATHVGPAARLLRLCSATTEDRAAIAGDIEAAFAAFGRGPDIRIPATVHVFACRARRQA
ncbi:class I SAM-dependent methyltransferase [Paracoccus sp. (in: a-proteobacteria)]|uniref:class I SAM-dependent methyltransferase n=1 Tax=Paracoccus sp. TaxID=267 RepID=UPI0035B23A0B